MLTVGALALAVITPALEPADYGTEAVATSLALSATPEFAAGPLSAGIPKRQLVEPVARPLSAQDPQRNRLHEIRFDAGWDRMSLYDGLQTRDDLDQRASRAVIRRVGPVRPALGIRAVPPVLRRSAVLTRPAARAVARRAVRPADRPIARIAGQPATRAASPVVRTARPVARAARPVVRTARPVDRAAARSVDRAARRSAAVVRSRVARPDRKSSSAITTKAAVRTKVVKKSRGASAHRLRSSSGMRAVIAYARSQVGKRYVRGGQGPHGFDCSGLTKRAFARAGVALPHSSGAQARRARSVERSQARAGDLVVGPGHVGIYMGNGMMIDAGNSRTGVVYRKVYRGLSVSRLR